MSLPSAVLLVGRVTVTAGSNVSVTTTVAVVEPVARNTSVTTRATVVSPSGNEAVGVADVASSKPGALHANVNYHRAYS